MLEISDLKYGKDPEKHEEVNNEIKFCLELEEEGFNFMRTSVKKTKRRLTLIEKQLIDEHHKNELLRECGCRKGKPHSKK